MTVASVSKKDIWSRLKSGNLVVSPWPDERAVGKGSIDLSVGSVFLSSKRSSVASVKARDPAAGSRLFNEVRIRAGSTFVMQPHQFVLASTLEYLSVPWDLAGLIQSRSTYGRMGLIAATAAWVGPGYKGSPTLELVNAGEVAIELPPEEPICQLILLTADEVRTQPSRYQCATRPSFALAHVEEWVEEFQEWLAQSKGESPLL